MFDHATESYRYVFWYIMIWYADAVCRIGLVYVSWWMFRKSTDVPFSHCLCTFSIVFLMSCLYIAWIWFSTLFQGRYADAFNYQSSWTVCSSPNSTAAIDYQVFCHFGVSWWWCRNCTDLHCWNKHLYVYVYIIMYIYICDNIYIYYTHVYSIFIVNFPYI